MRSFSSRAGEAIFWLRILLVASVALPAVLFVYASAVDYRWQFADARERLARTAGIAQEHAATVLQTHELLLAQVEDEVRGLSTDQIVARQAELHARFATLRAGLPEVEDIDVAGRDGRLLVDARAFPVASSVNVMDGHYAVAEKSKDQTYISPILHGRATGRPFFALAQRLPRSDGSFAGLVWVSAEPGYFEQLYARMLGDQAERGNSIMLARASGDILVRVPEAGPEKIDLAAAFRPHGALAREGLVDLPGSASGGRDRIMAFRRIGDYPLYVAAAIPRDVILADWFRTMAMHLVFGVPVTACLFLITLLALRRTTSFAVEHERRLAAETALSHGKRLEVIGRLTGGVAHDFNNLLTAILGNLDVARNMVREAPPVHAIDNAVRAAERGARLTESLLAFARRQRLRTEIVDANALLRDFALLATRALPETIRLTLALDPEPLYCRADSAQLDSALLNLVINARDAMGEGGGTLTLATGRRELSAEALAQNDEARPGPFVLVSVSDTGTGMSPEILARAFEPFFTTKDVGKGSGLGLSQVFGFVRQLGGHVEIESRPGRGTTVSLYLRAAAAPAGQAAAEQPAAGGTVLLVEDEAEVHGITRDMLQDAGFEVLCAADDRAAVSILEREPIDLLLSDVAMPGGMSGPALGRLARAVQPGLAVLLMSDHGVAASLARGVDAGEFELIDKPFHREDLIARIGAALRKSAASAPRA